MVLTSLMTASSQAMCSCFKASKSHILKAQAPRLGQTHLWGSCAARSCGTSLLQKAKVELQTNSRVGYSRIVAFSSASSTMDKEKGFMSSGMDTTWEIRLLYDGDCPLCMREVNMLMDRDAGQGKISFVDISDSSYDPSQNSGVTYEEAMGHIHGILPDGSVVTNIEVFRRCYEAVGLGWVYAATKYEPIRKAADAVYGVWAKYRLPLTGRDDLKMVLEMRRDDLGEMGCGTESDSCELPWAAAADDEKEK